jgi:CYTH domain-containing protein
MANDAFIFTSKTRKNDDSRYEIERNISESTYRELLENQHLPHIMKTRYLWTDEQGLTWEVDEYEGMFAGLVVAEVELNEEQEINQIPHWAGQEITGLGVLSNHSLATLAEQFRP